MLSKNAWLQKRGSYHLTVRLHCCLSLINYSTVDCIYLWTHALKTCFQMTSNVSVSGAQLWSFADRNANFCTQNTHHKHWVRSKLYTRNDSSEPVYAYRHRSASVSQKKFLYLIFLPFQNQNVLNFKLPLRAAKLQSLTPETLTFDIIWKHVFGACVHR